MDDKILASVQNLNSDGTNFSITDDSKKASGNEFLHIVSAFCAVLAAKNIKKQDRVIISTTKSINQAACIVACYVSEVIFVPLLPDQNYLSVAHILANCEPKLLFVDSKRSEELISDIPRFLIDDVEPLITDDLWVSKVKMPLSLHDPACIIYSSGSTGMPKGICFSRSNIINGALIVSSFTGLTPEDKIFSPLSLNFDYGLNQLWQSLLVDCQIRLHEYIYPMAFLRALEEFKGTIIPVMPIFIANLLDERFKDKIKRYNVECVRLLTTSGGMVSETLQNKLQDLFADAQIMLMYGLTEAFRSTYLDPNERARRPHSIGKAIPSARVWVGKEDLSPCKPGEVGEILHSGGCMSLGYWNDTEKTEKRFVRDSLTPNQLILKTGDYGYVDEDGYLFYAGRMDEMIKTKGHRVSPFEIEKIGMENPRIKKCMVFGIEDEFLTNKIVFCYEAVDAGVSETELKLFFQQRCPGHQVPEIYQKIDKFAETGNQGKIDRLKVKKTALSAINA
jgi:acyl-CoA synthetase (AMP-forming)/AMP-acid ligase II